MGGESKPEDEYKKTKINNLLIEIKFRFLKEMNRYVPLYFHETNVLAPSIEIFEGRNLKDEKNTEPLLEYYGICRGEHILYDSNDNYEFYATFLNDLASSNTIKILSNSGQIDGLFSDSYLLRTLEEALGELMSINTLINRVDEKLAALKIDFANLIHKRHISYDKFIKLRFQLENMSNMLYVIKKEITESVFDANLMICCTIFNIKEEDVSECLFNFIKKLVESQLKKILDKIKQSNNMIDGFLSIYALSSDKKLSRKTVFLSWLTVILTIFTIYLTYKQINTTININPINDILFGINCLKIKLCNMINIIISRCIGD